MVLTELFFLNNFVIWHCLHNKKKFILTALIAAKKKKIVARFLYIPV